jgi:hypothetical protein
MGSWGTTMSGRLLFFPPAPLTLLALDALAGLGSCSVTTVAATDTAAGACFFFVAFLACWVVRAQSVPKEEQKGGRGRKREE